MSGPVSVEARSLRALRWRARAPRLLVLGCVGVLALAGLRAALAPATPPQATPTVATRVDPGVGAFAEAFARVYLSADPARSEWRERRLAAVLARGP